MTSGLVKLPEVKGVDPIEVRLISHAIDSEGDFDPALYAHLRDSETSHAMAVITVLRAHGETRKIFHGFSEAAASKWESLQPKH